MAPLNPVTKRGRPKSDGKQPTWMLLRITVILAAFQQARRDGEKHTAAIDLAVAAARKEFPQQKTSATTVKRILAEWMDGTGNNESMLVSVTPGHDVPGIGYKPTGKTYSIGFGTRPEVKRANAHNRLRPPRRSDPGTNR